MGSAKSKFKGSECCKVEVVIEDKNAPRYMKKLNFCIMGSISVNSSSMDLFFFNRFIVHEESTKSFRSSMKKYEKY